VLLYNDYLLFIYAHDIMIWITRSSDLHSDNIITTTTTTTILFAETRDREPDRQ